MGEVINLNKHRKLAERRREAQAAAENRRKFGRDKAERRSEADEIERRERSLDGHRRDDRPDATPPGPSRR
jgi:hypothetical protein